ncbi:MAG: ABC transporter ATP-binding protein [Thalassolituus oleivorans]|uniref:ABC transporter ATP-binding protein n=1 Tax=Thalassolituus oleivorans TaxID=187493 RepID=UPI001B660158|nr:ABC transporter ATP-binding protein [Thalassolituus oleivorans]MBQ0727004.1 ABC transporter ATP-binding protein [Thalassolituus oleivorans]
MVPALMVEGLAKVYGNGFEALKGINLTVQQGDFFALLGPNGAGKSTTLGIVSSLIQKTSGSASIMGFDVSKQAFDAKRHLGVVPQEFNFNQFEKVYDIVVTQAGYFGMTRKEAATSTEKLLRQLDLWDKRDQPSRMLSGGMKRRLMIARALVHGPKVLILDEPTAGVDIELRRSMWAFMQELNKSGTTIILTTHYLEEAEQLCRNIAIINKGLIVKCMSTRELLSQLKTETFVFDLISPVTESFSLPGFETNIANLESIEVTVEKGQSINQIFALLTEQGAEVRSMRTKSNRLEELFVGLVQGDNA